MSEIHSVVYNDEQTEAIGRAKYRPYEFEITSFLRKEGYIAKVTDFYPANDGNGYYWAATIKKRDPQIVTEDRYRKITNCSGLDEWNVRFGIEEMQEMLIAHGYEIIVHSAKGEIIETESIAGTGEVRKTGRRWIENVERILALKPDEKHNLPVWNDSYRASYLDFQNVFKRLIKSKLAFDPTNLLNRIKDLERKLGKKEDDEWTHNIEASERK